MKVYVVDKEERQTVLSQNNKTSVCLLFKIKRNVCFLFIAEVSVLHFLFSAAQYFFIYKYLYKNWVTDVKTWVITTEKGEKASLKYIHWT